MKIVEKKEEVRVYMNVPEKVFEAVCKCFANEPEWGCFAIYCISVVLGLVGVLCIISIIGVPLGAYLAPMLIGGGTFWDYSANGMRCFRWALQASWVIGNLVFVVLLLVGISWILYEHVQKYRKLMEWDEEFREQIFSDTSWYGIKILLYKVYAFVTLRLPRVAGRGERRWMIILGVRIPLN